jgi:RNA-directed DNA polymerase
MARSETLRRSGAPVIYSLKHLALTTDVEFRFLLSVIRRTAPAYRAIRIPKNAGGFRDLLSPSESLMTVQRWILHEILNHVPRHTNNFAYFRKVTARECAQRHAGAKWMIKADLHNYFPSISEKRVYSVFKGLGYSSLVSFELARLCTWSPTQAPERSITFDGSPSRASSFEPYAPLAPGVLPQGAPTSGALANAATARLDDALSDLAVKHHMVYTRYSDDMTFSSPHGFDRRLAAQIISEIRRLVTASGLELHTRKTRIIPPGARKIVLGMLVTETGVSILPEHRRMIDLHVHAVRKYGPVEYAARRGFESVLSFINHVEGWLAYLSHIDEPWAKEKGHAWSSALAHHHVSLKALG